MLGALDLRATDTRAVAREARVERVLLPMSVSDRLDPTAKPAVQGLATVVTPPARRPSRARLRQPPR